MDDDNYPPGACRVCGREPGLWEAIDQRDEARAEVARLRTAIEVHRAHWGSIREPGAAIDQELYAVLEMKADGTSG